MVCSAVLGVTYCCVVIFQCNPISFWWDLNPDHTGKCLSASLVTNLTYVVSALNSVADWTFASLPIFIIKDLQMKKSSKVIVSTIIGFAAMYVSSQKEKDTRMLTEAKVEARQRLFAFPTHGH
jgi:hypothetical protein